MKSVLISSLILLNACTGQTYLGFGNKIVGSGNSNAENPADYGTPLGNDLLTGPSAGDSYPTTGQSLGWMPRYQLIETFATTLGLEGQSRTDYLQRDFGTTFNTNGLRVTLNPSSELGTLTPLAILSTIELADRGCARGQPAMIAGLTVARPSTMLNTAEKRLQVVRTLIDRSWGEGSPPAFREFAESELTSSIEELLPPTLNDTVASSQTILRVLCGILLSSSEMTLK